MSLSPQPLESAGPATDTLKEWTGSPLAEYLSDIVRFPGFGEVGGDGCLQLKPIGFCEAGHVQIGGADPCGRRDCPHCWRQWRRRAVIKIVERLAAVRFLRGGPRSRGRRLLHTVNAPDQEQRWTTERFWNERSASKDAIEEIGGDGGVCIPHAYRTSEGGDELWRDLGGAVAQERGKWAVLREFAGDEWETMKAFSKVEPHTHHAVPAEDFDGDRAKEIETETGRIVENIRAFERFYVDATEALPLLSRRERAAARRADGDELENMRETARETALAGYEDMARWAFYVTSHAVGQEEVGDLPRRNTVTYWGEVHAVTPEEDLPYEVWASIQEYAEAAVDGTIPGEEEEEGTGRRCSREDCEQPVRPLSELVDRMADPDHSWWDGLDYEQQLELLGAAQWMSDKPPPGVEGPGVVTTEFVGGEEREREASTLPPGGFERSPRVPERVETAEDLLEWLRRLGRRRVERGKFPFLTVGMEPA